MSVNEIHKNDIGTILRVTIYDGSTIVDISTATTKTIYLRKPNGVILTKTAVFYTDGSDGIIQYIVQSTDLDQDGTWGIQAYIVLSDGSWRTDMSTFIVYRNIYG